MRPIKLLISGPVSAGKTTFIGTLSETPVISTDEVATDEVALQKTHTTVALDFGELHLDGTVIHLYGTPGQERFDFMWEILAEGACGYLILVPGDDPAALPKARKIMDVLASRLDVPFLVGVSKQDLREVWTPDDVACYFRLPPELVQGVVCTDAGSSRALLATLVELAATAPGCQQ
jgi:signal recognition particle receptor subunit beta